MSIKILYSILSVSLIVSVNSLNCKSAAKSELDITEVDVCWKEFCTCARFDNCSKIGNNLEDVFVLLWTRLNLMSCGGKYAINVESGEKKDQDVRYRVYKEGNRMLRMISEIPPIMKMRYSFTDPALRYPINLVNYFWGQNMRGMGIIEGKFYFRNRHENLPNVVDPYTWIDLCYYKMNYLLKYKTKFDSQPVIGSEDSVLFGPFGSLSLWRKRITYYLFPFVQYINLSNQMSIEAKVSEVNFGSDSMFRDIHLRYWTLSEIKLTVCIGQTLNQLGEPYWTSEGCRPVLEYFPSPLSETHYLGNQFNIKCQCDWQKNPPSNSSTFIGSNSASGRLGTSDANTKRGNAGLILGVILLAISLIIASFFTGFLVKTLTFSEN